MPWIDRAIKLVAPHAEQITLRGDTDFTLTGELDRWDRQGVKFIFGMDAHAKVVNLAEALPKEAWKPLERVPRYEIATAPRRKPERVKESIVRFKLLPHHVHWATVLRIGIAWAASLPVSMAAGAAVFAILDAVR